MKLSDGEKLILVMLADIYDHLRLKRQDANLIREAIATGNTWAIHWEPDSVLDEVVDILDMWEFLERGYKRLPANEQKRVEKETHRNQPVEFTGLDADEENHHVRVADFLINHMKRYENFKGRPLANAGYSIEKHRQMQKVFEPLRPTHSNKDLSADQIIKILNS